VSKRSDKMYKDSPKIESDGEGKKTVSKKSKEAERTDDGTEGMPIDEMDVRHAKERLVLHHKHEIDHAEMEAKHVKEKLSKKKGE